MTHLFFMDDLKLYAKDDCGLEGLLRVVKGFSDNIGMEFGLSNKCANATFRRGKLEKSDYIQLYEEIMIKDLEQEKAYKYFGVDESSRIQHATIKQKLKKELNSKNRINAINMLAILVITYSFKIIDWNISEVRRLDVKVRKMTTTHSMHHPKANIHRLYLPRSKGVRGLTQLEFS